MQCRQTPRVLVCYNVARIIYGGVILELINHYGGGFLVHSVQIGAGIRELVDSYPKFTFFKVQGEARTSKETQQQKIKVLEE